MTFAFVVALLIGISVLVGTDLVGPVHRSWSAAEPDLDDVREVDVPYLCSVCGLSLTVTQAQDGEISAPRHCREDMIEA